MLSRRVLLDESDSAIELARKGCFEVDNGVSVDIDVRSGSRPRTGACKEANERGRAVAATGPVSADSCIFNDTR